MACACVNPFIKPCSRSRGCPRVLGLFFTPSEQSRSPPGPVGTSPGLWGSGELRGAGSELRAVSHRPLLGQGRCLHVL